MFQAKWFVVFLLVLGSGSAIATQNKAATTGAKKAGAALTASQPVIPEPHSSKQVPHPVVVNRHGLMAAQHPGLSYRLDQANLPPSGKVYSFPELSKARFLSPVNIHPAEFPKSRAPQINKHKLLMAKPHFVNPVQ